MPFLIILLAGTAIAGFASANSEREKRARMQAYYASQIASLSARIAELEEQYTHLVNRLSWHDQQVRRLGEEIVRLRNELLSYQRAVAA
jgi:chromosome segregation ATPase